MSVIEKKIKEYKKLFFGNKSVMTINFDTLETLAVGKWIATNGTKLIGKKIGHKNLFFYGEWEKGAIMDYHDHDDCEEVIEVVEGSFKLNEKRILMKGDKRTFYKNEVHRLEAMEESQLIVICEKIYK
mgnify:CR=1 FL=1